jgi:hypothetical protein
MPAAVLALVVLRDEAVCGFVGLVDGQGGDRRPLSEASRCECYLGRVFPPCTRTFDATLERP